MYILFVSMPKCELGMSGIWRQTRLCLQGFTFYTEWAMDEKNGRHRRTQKSAEKDMHSLFLSHF